jgi:hypothetical protein
MSQKRNPIPDEYQRLKSGQADKGFGVAKSGYLRFFVVHISLLSIEW